MTNEPDIELLTLDDGARVVTEVTHSNPGITRDDLQAALDAMHNLSLDAALWHAWQTNQLRVGWHDGELSWHPGDDATS